MEADPNKLLPLLLPVLILALIVRRGLRERRLNADRLWVLPLLLLFVAGSSLYAAPPTSAFGYAVVAISAALGAVAGWWRGRLTNIVVNPDSHELTSRTSPIGVIVIAAIYLLRYGVRYLMQANPTAVPGGATLATDALMVLAIAMIAVQRLEMWLRAEQLLKSARAAKIG
jgi:hypothetical protein